MGAVEIVEQPTQTPIVISEDESEKMPPPMMPPPKPRARPRTRKAAKQAEESCVEEKRGTRTRIKEERVSTIASTSETISDESTTTTRVTRTKSKKVSFFFCVN